MKSKLLTAVALTAALMLPALTVQAQDIKIGYVSSERILRESNMAKAAQLKLATEFGKREKDLKDAEAKLRAAAEQFDKDSPALSDAERSRRQRELADGDRDLQRRQREYQEDVTQRRNEAMAELGERANRVIQQIFDSEHYDLIVQDAPYVSARVDITKKVIDALNAQK